MAHKIITKQAKHVSNNKPNTAVKLKRIEEKEYQMAIQNLGLLEGERIILQYVCVREFTQPASLFNEAEVDVKRGLLIFTNDNLIFMQRDGVFNISYSQALRIPLEQIIGISSGGFLVKKIQFTLNSNPVPIIFVNFMSTFEIQEIHEVRADIERHLTNVRQEKKRLAQEALTKGTLPAMFFCRYCGTRNKADESKCVSCGAKR